MKRYVLTGFVLLSLSSAAQNSSPFKLLQTLPLPGVEGRIDHLAFDEASQQLFVAALGNDTLEVVNLKTQTVKSLKGFSEPQGVVVLPVQHQVFVSNGGDGTGVFLDSDTLKEVRRVQVGADADNVRFDGKRLFVGYGSALAVLDLQGSRLLDIKLSAHPESLQLESDKNAVTQRVFINVPGVNHVAVVDLEKHAVIATWNVPAASNYPMALDPLHHRLWVATRAPARLIALDTNSGKVLNNLETVGDADDVFVDGSRVYVSGGAGAVDVLEARAENYVQSARVKTASGARTSLFDPISKRLFIAVPHRGNQVAAIFVYQVLK